MTRKSSSGLSILLAEIGVTRRRLPAVILIIALFEVAIIGFAALQACVEHALGWPPIITFIVVWIVWTWWHSWLFPRRRLLYLTRYKHPYRRAFILDIYPWVSIGFSQMWRPLLNGDTLDRLLAGR